MGVFSGVRRDDTSAGSDALGGLAGAISVPCFSAALLPFFPGGNFPFRLLSFMQESCL